MVKKSPEKKCIRCFKTKSLDVFEKKKRELNYRNICFTCRSSANKIATQLKRAYVKEHGQPDAYSSCSICSATPKTLVFDHCHKTNVFRGWICRSCNCAIGKLGDDVQGLQKALAYLQEFENKT